MYLNLRVYLFVFVFIDCVFILWSFVVQFFVFVNFSNVLQVFIMYLNLRVYLFAFVFDVEVLFIFLLYLLILVMFKSSLLCSIIEVLFSFLYFLGRKEFLFHWQFSAGISKQMMYTQALKVSGTEGKLHVKSWFFD